MAKQETLRRVEEDIAAGNLGKARDRLHGLVQQYPDDLSLRSRLAEVYWQLRFPAMAGCYWYLEEPTTEAMRQAQAEFERSCGRDPLHILLRLKFRGNVESLPQYARLQLERLQEECQRKHGRYPAFRSGGKRWQLTQPASWGCFLALFALFVLAAVGLVTVLDGLISLLRQMIHR